MGSKLMDETLISALINIPFAAVLAYWIKLDFAQRAENMRTMQKMVAMFTSTMKECCVGRTVSSEPERPTE